MSDPYDQNYPPKSSAGRKSITARLALPLIAFAGGVAAMGYGLSQWDQGAALLGIGSTTARHDQPAALQTDGTDGRGRESAASENAADNDPNVQSDLLHARLQALEDRMDRLAARTEATSGNASRAEGMLIAFAARRALDRGVQLGYIESLLRDRFGASQPQAVATIIAGARDRVTLDRLRTGFEEIAPTLIGGTPNESWWDKLRREFSGLVVVRHGDTPSTQPEQVVSRIRAAIANNEIDRALIEISRMPQQDKARQWIGLARSYVMMRNALDRIETAALIDPVSDRPVPARDAEAPENPDPIVPPSPDTPPFAAEAI